MSRSTSLACLCLAFSCVLGCGDAQKATPTAVKGTVEMDGKPMPEGEIMLSLPGQGPSVLTIKDGSFSGTALQGKNRVEIRAFKSGPPLSTDPTGAPTKVNYIPARYNDQTTFTAEVAGTGMNPSKFEVQSK